jgi:transcriptional regulator with XRE-family HTH domain
MVPFEMQSAEELVVDLGFRLRKIRLNKNHTQVALAAMAGVSLTAIRNIEGGKGSTVDTFVRVLKALDNARAIEFLAPTPTVSPIALLHRRDRKKPQQRAVSRSLRSIAKRKREAEDEFIATLEDTLTLVTERRR